MDIWMKEQAEELINSGNSREKAEGMGMMEVIKTIKNVIEMETLYGEGDNDGFIVDTIMGLIKNFNENAWELVDIGNSREQAEGLGMTRIIEPITKLINIDGEVATDGEVIDMIYDLIINNK